MVCGIDVRTEFGSLFCAIESISLRAEFFEFLFASCGELAPHWSNAERMPKLLSAKLFVFLQLNWQAVPKIESTTNHVPS